MRPAGCVVKYQNIQIFLQFYALPAGRPDDQNHQLIFLQALIRAEEGAENHFTQGETLILS